MNSKEKCICSIVLTIVGGTLLITSIAFGVIHITNGLYEDIYTFPARLSHKNSQETAGTFIAKADNVFSFWLKVPDRRIEEQDFRLSVILDDLASDLQTTWYCDFKTAYLRDSSGQGQYYQIGTHRFIDDFYGRLKYLANGKWVAPYNAYIVVRKVKALKWPKKQILLSFIGLIILCHGINLLIKYLKKIHDETLAECKRNK